MALRTDYKNAVFSGKRKYHLIENEDGTVSLLDATQYSQTGDRFGAKDVNAIGTAVNGLADSIGDAFSEERAYAVGEYAIYENILYEFTAAKAAGPWEPDAATPTTIAEVVRELNGNMTDFIIISGGSINIGKLSAGEQGDKNVPINPPEGYKYFTYACGCSSPEISVHKYSNGTPKIIYRAISGVSSALLFYEVTYVKK